MSMVSAGELERSVRELWQSVLGLDATRIEASAPFAGRETIAGSVDISGAWEGTLVLELSTPLALRASSIALQKASLDLTDADVGDMVGEMTNILGGTLKALAPGHSVLSLPTILQVSTAVLAREPSLRLVAQVALACDGEPVAATLYQGKFPNLKRYLSSAPI